MPAETPPCPVILVICGPAGSGKTTLCDRLLGEFSESIDRLVTTTSRDPRPGEKDGVDYHFIKSDVFKESIRSGKFIEWALVHGRYYGSQAKHLRGQLEKGKDLLLNIDVQGARSFRRHRDSGQDLPGRLCTVFIKPKSFDQLRERLWKRGSDDEAEIERRMRTAVAECREADTFDEVILSGSMDADYAAIRALYLRLKKESTGPVQ